MKAKTAKSIQKIKRILLSHKQDLSDKYGVREIGIFGSYVKNEHKKNSDIDILVDLEKPMGFFKFIRLERYLSELLGAKVDLVTKNALKPHIGQRILAEVIYV